MKLVLGEIRPMIMVLPKVMRERLPAKTAYWFARTLRELSEHMKDFEEARRNLLEKHAKKDKKGEFIVVNGEYDVRNRPAFDKEFRGLADQEISIKFEGVTLKQLGSADVRSIDQFSLGKLIKDEGEPKDENEEKKSEVQDIDKEIKKLEDLKKEKEKKA